MSAGNPTPDELRDLRAQLDRIEAALAITDPRPVLTSDEAASHCKFRRVDTFSRWARRMRIKRIAENRWSRTALDRAMMREAGKL